MFKQKEKSFSLLDRIWEQVPTVSDNEARTDIEQAIVAGRSETASKDHELS